MQCTDLKADSIQLEKWPFLKNKPGGEECNNGCQHKPIPNIINSEANVPILVSLTQYNVQNLARATEQDQDMEECVVAQQRLLVQGTQPTSDH